MAALKKDNAKLEQAFSEIIQAFIALEEQLEKKYSDDDEAYSSAMVETIESVLDSILEEGDITTTNIAQMLAVFTEALEEIDPNAFEDLVNDDDDDDDYDLDDEELEEYNEDDDDEDDDEDDR
ncbi:MAG: hypothetical protein LBE20_00525 [Deltaproteobacteria bacterium]|jgi:DNA-directed RNA polymerase subunit delta|nr:hypothetical protein [Deltaproteobacteria bacterium]